ncbi:hexapeptide transferase [Synechococcus sp. A18-40]|nr:hexapeptide transferase [Synechococcus sp. A18-40]
MRFRGMNYKVNSVEFHHQFGWTVSSDVGKAYLGKIILAPSLPVTIGLMSYLSGCSTVKGRDVLEVGSFSSLASNMHVTTSSYSHPTHLPSTFNFNGNSRIVNECMNFDITFEPRTPAKTGVFIGNDVWVGRDVSIKNGVRLGNGCVIGERALVVKDCEPYGIYGGVPARLIRYRFSHDIIAQLLAIAWWDWPYDKIVRNKLFFDTDLLSYGGSLESLIVQ